MTQEFDIIKIINSGATTQPQRDILAIEEPLEISVKIDSTSGILPISVTMRTPGNDEELAVGFLFTEGILHSVADLEDKISSQVEDNKIVIRFREGSQVNLSSLQRNFYTTSSCGICGKASIEAVKQSLTRPETSMDFQVNWRLIASLPEIIRPHQKTFEKTGGIHASALFDQDGNLLNIREDVGRHNALDKLIGAEFLKLKQKECNVNQKILLLSGRISFELIQKSAMAGISIVCAIGAPSSLAVSTAEELGITLIGFLKNGNGNVYSCPERIYM